MYMLASFSDHRQASAVVSTKAGGVKTDTSRDTLARIRGLAVLAGIWLTAS